MLFTYKGMKRNERDLERRNALNTKNYFGRTIGRPVLGKPRNERRRAQQALKAAA